MSVEILWDERPQHCTVCGLLLVVCHRKPWRRSSETGEWEPDVALVCPKHPRSAWKYLFSRNHDCYPLLPSRHTPGKYLAPLMMERWR